MPAKYDLNIVQSLVKEWFTGDDDKMWFTPRKKSYGAVGFVLNENDATAQVTIAAGLMELTPNDFYQQTYLSGRTVVADVYGLESFRGHNWYVKFFIHEDEADLCLASVSFHPLDEAMKHENGRILTTTYQGERPWKSN